MTSNSQEIATNMEGFTSCTICNYLNISIGLVAGVRAMTSQSTQMQPMAISFMLGHAAELLAKVVLLEKGNVSEEQLRNPKKQETFRSQH